MFSSAPYDYQIQSVVEEKLVDNFGRAKQILSTYSAYGTWAIIVREWHKILDVQLHDHSDLIWLSEPYRYSEAL